MFLMDALWVNERLHDYTTTMDGAALEGEDSRVVNIEWSEDEDDMPGL